MKSRTFLANSQLGLFLICFALTSSSGAVVQRPEHPRPDAMRETWMTLNGEWQFEIDEQADGEARGLVSGKELGSRIIVPFCPESKLSGVAHYGFMKHTWYRRTFDLPASMEDKRVRLHFGAVDYKAWVWVNGQLAGSHVGGNVAFNFDITKLLKNRNNQLVVRVFDDAANGKQATGKQTHTVNEGCVYTRTTGIWQPVSISTTVSPSLIPSASMLSPHDKPHTRRPGRVRASPPFVLSATGKCW